MSSNSVRGAGVSQSDRPAPHKWIFSREEMKQTASQRDGMSFEEELSHRQQAASFIQEMVEMLNQNFKDPRGKITQLGMCVANVHMHRFFYFHSFKKFDYRDIAAACLFLSGKSEESPQKLSSIVSVWREKKFKKPFSSDIHRNEAGQLMVLLESCVLQTIAFDLNVDLPHQHVLRIMDKFDKNGHRKKITACAYYFATDVLCVMDWAVRYSCKAIAVAVVHLVSIYANFKIESLFSYDDKKKWFLEYDSEMTDVKLKEMENEFMRVYNSCSHLHYASRINFSSFKTQSNQVLDENQKKVDSRRSPRSNFISDCQSMNADSTNGKSGRSGFYDEMRKKDDRIIDRTVEKLDRDRKIEERKREYERMSASRFDQPSSTEKRAKIGPLSTNFVSSTSTTGQNGKVSSSNYPNQYMKTSSSSHQLAALAKRPEKPLSPVLQNRFEASSTLTPPPLPPAISTSSPSSDMDLEEGELE